MNLIRSYNGMDRRINSSTSFQRNLFFGRTTDPLILTPNESRIKLKDILEVLSRLPVNNL